MPQRGQLPDRIMLLKNGPHVTYYPNGAETVGFLEHFSIFIFSAQKASFPRIRPHEFGARFFRLFHIYELTGSGLQGARGATYALWNPTRQRSILARVSWSVTRKGSRCAPNMISMARFPASIVSESIAVRSASAYDEVQAIYAA